MLSARLSRYVPESYRQDLYSFGLIGLMDAVDKFRPELGNRFETYGSRRIRGAMSDGMRTLRWIPHRAGQAASGVIEKVIPVDFQTATGPDGTRLEDSLPDPDWSAWDAIELASDHVEVGEALDLLPERERFVIVERYYGRRSLADIGSDLWRHRISRVPAPPARAPAARGNPCREPGSRTNRVTTALR
jgi:RNA polymerase sigma factor (sigma-70 family)